MSKRDEILQGEARAVTKLCRDANRNIVQVINHGWLDRTLRFYYFDMEYCPFTLEDYICNQPIRPVSYLAQYWKEDAMFWDSFIMALAILLDITRGLEFIHEQKEVHRDLKPSNGEYGL